jgi:hypothetical protein
MATPHGRRRIVGILIVVVVAVSVFLALVWLPVPQEFTIKGAAIYDPDNTCSPGVETTKGTTVSFHWSTPSPTVFFVVHCGAIYDVPYVGNGTSGSGSVVSAGGIYQFGASCPEGPCVTADVSGSFTGPLLPL